MAYVHGKVAVVTGASSGLGREVAIVLAQAGARLVLAARRTDRLDALVADFAAQDVAAIAVACDVRDEDQVVSLFAQALDRFGRVDLLVNNAGIADHTPTSELSVERWREVVDTNLTGAFLCAREAFRIMKLQGGGRMLHIGSLSATMPRPNAAAYTASKFALAGLNHSIALDGRPFGICSSIFHPGVIGTELDGGRTPASAVDPTSRIGASVAARSAMAMIDLPDHVNFLEGTILPISMPYLGRG